MVTKGIIKTIDYNGNTCVVRLPLFETATNRGDVDTTAIISTIPGIFNGYKEGDVVLVAFEDNKVDAPVVIGKLYLGASKENDTNRGSISCESLTATSPLTIPITTKLTLDNDPNNLAQVGVDNDLSTYKSIADIARGLQRQESQIGDINVKIIDDGENLGARLAKVEADDIRHEAEIIANAEEISTKVATTSGEVSEGLGWNLTSTEWNLTRYYTDPDTHEDKEVKVLEATKDGLKIEGEISATTGEIGGFKIESDNIHSGNKTSYDSNVDGVYLGTDGIGLGQGAFYVTKNGQIYVKDYATENYASTAASNAETAAKNYSEASTTSAAYTKANNAYTLADGKSTTTYSATVPSSPKTGDCWFDTTNSVLKQYTGSAWEDIGEDIVANKVTAAYVNALNITAGKLTVTGTQGTIFNADANDSTSVQIGGFEVDHNSLSTIGKNPGDANSIMLFSGTNDSSTSIGGSPTRNDWSITAGSSFGVASTGEVYANNINLNNNVVIKKVPMNVYNVGSTCDAVTITCNERRWSYNNKTTIEFSFKAVDSITLQPKNLTSALTIDYAIVWAYYQNGYGVTLYYYQLNRGTTTIPANSSSSETITDSFTTSNNQYIDSGATHIRFSPDKKVIGAGDFKNEFGDFLNSKNCFVKGYRFRCKDWDIYSIGAGYWKGSTTRCYYSEGFGGGGDWNASGNAWNNDFSIAALDLGALLGWKYKDFSKIYSIKVEFGSKRKNSTWTEVTAGSNIGTSWCWTLQTPTGDWDFNGEYIDLSHYNRLGRSDDDAVYGLPEEARLVIYFGDYYRRGLKSSFSQNYSPSDAVLTDVFVTVYGEKYSGN